MSKIFERIVEQRGIDEWFLNPDYSGKMKQGLESEIGKVIQRLKMAIERQERILIYGDYDVDGVTASAVMYEALKLAGIEKIEIMLPNRFQDGYGMSKKVVKRCQESQDDSDGAISLVLTVDCGSRNHEIVEELKSIGVEVIVTDHHECGEDLPVAIAVVNPKRKDKKISKEAQNLAGVGVAFGIVEGMRDARMIPEGQEKWLLDLVLLGTVCDSMPMTGENRRLCFYGMKVLEKTRRPGLRELMRNAGVKKINGEAIGFQIGPRLNAAGRMETADKALELLLTKSRVQAAKLAMELEELNRRRRQEQMAAVNEISEQGIGDEPVIVKQGDWHEGILGIIAGKLTEEYQRPSFVFGQSGEILKGSGRSFGDFNLAEALKFCQGEIIGGGGHAEACGVKLLPERYEDFRKKMNQYYRSLGLKNQEEYLAIREDLVVTELNDLSLELIEELRKLEPYGVGNEEPIFLLPDMRVTDVARLGMDGEHLRLQLMDQNGAEMKVMWFFAPAEYLEMRGGGRFSAWVRLEENEFRGIRSVEGRVVRGEWG